MRNRQPAVDELVDPARESCVERSEFVAPITGIHRSIHMRRANCASIFRSQQCIEHDVQTVVVPTFQAPGSAFRE